MSDPYPSLQEHVSEVGHPLLQGQQDLGRWRPGVLVPSVRLLGLRVHVAFGPLRHKTQQVKHALETQLLFPEAWKALRVTKKPGRVL